MKPNTGKQLFRNCLLSIGGAILVWQCLFFKNPSLKGICWEIHTIFTSTLLAYFFAKQAIKDEYLDLLKVAFRTIFRVWLIIFITFAMNKPMERVGFVLSITFILGYFEGLLDIDKWLAGKNDLPFVRPDWLQGKRDHAFLTIIFMSAVHVVCALVVFVFYVFI